MSSVRPARARTPAPAFREVDAARTDARFRKAVVRALTFLRDSGTPIGQATFRIITSGQVRVDTFSDLTLEDYRHVNRDMQLAPPQSARADHRRLREKHSNVLERIQQALDGYQWDDRVYLNPTTGDRSLARTLVHEVNHVLNRSEENYRGAKAQLREEYRAVYAEELLKGRAPTAERCRKLKLEVIRDYGLNGLTPADVSDVPPGVLVPRG